jgi:putative transposase
LDELLPISQPAGSRRAVQSIQQECLDHLIVCGAGHFDYLVSEYVAYMKEQAEGFIRHCQADKLPATLVFRDRDGAYSPHFDAVLRNSGIGVRKTSPKSPNLQAYVERFIQSIQQECLDHFIVCGAGHFDYLVSEYVAHYHTERPHQSLGNVPLTGEWPEVDKGRPPDGEIVRRERLGGLLKHYERAAA